MKPESPDMNGDGSNPFSSMKLLASAMNIPADMEGDYDMDDEIMDVMHSHIQKQLLKFTKKDPSEDNQGMMDGDTKAYFDEIIRGSALFGILPDNGGEFDDEDKENDDSFFSGPATDNASDTQGSEGDDTVSEARFQLSKILLAKKVSEAFNLKGDATSKEDKACLPSIGRTGYMAWGSKLFSGNGNTSQAEDPNSDNADRVSHHSVYSIETDLGAETEKLREEDNAPELARRLESDLAGTIVALWQERLTQSSSQEGDIDIEYASDVNSTGPPTPRGDDPSAISRALDGNGNRSADAPTRLPLSLPSDDSYNSALEEIRGRLRKTQFDYTSDSGQKTPEAKPVVDYRNVLKKKDQP